ncbi:hypothetical protein T492DRAFT_979583 [Pavlovales sp. CCMP2436]|nr:hypothetical protein T492DRAFT_979583 [Pavlovales sp. CCMP2436]
MAYVELVRTQAAQRRAGSELLTRRREALLRGGALGPPRRAIAGVTAAQSPRTLSLAPGGGMMPAAASVAARSLDLLEPPRRLGGYAARSVRSVSLRAGEVVPAAPAAGPAAPEHQPPSSAATPGSTASTRYKEMEQTGARLVAELERSDREWRGCVDQLEARVSALERENAQLRQALHQSQFPSVATTRAEMASPGLWTSEAGRHVLELSPARLRRRSELLRESCASPRPHTMR